MGEVLRFDAKPLSDAEAASLAADLGERPLDGRHYDCVIRGTATTALGPDGAPLLVVRPGALRPSLCGEAVRAAIRRAARPSQNNGGRRSNLVGYFERDRSHPYCRLCFFTRDDPEGSRHINRLFRDLNRVYRSWCRDAESGAYADQWRFVRRTSKDFVIPGTVFTTGTANNTEVHPVHRHPGNLSLGLSVMGVLRRGAYGGGLFVLPQWRLAVDLHDRDVVLFESGAWHGNTPFEAGAGDFERLSFVAYYRSGMIDCGTAAEEYARADRLANRR
jgi:hypothetical protein